MHDARIGGFRRLGMLGSLALAAGGCTDDHTGVGDPDAARTFVTQLARVSAGVTAMNGPEVAAGLQGMLSEGQHVVGPGGDMRLRGLVYQTPQFTGTGVCAPPVCDLMAYRAELFLTEGFQIDASITLTADGTTIAMQYREYGKVRTSHWDFDGRFLTTGSKLDGVFNGHGMTSDGMSTDTLTPDPAMWDLTIRVEGVVLDAQGCPTSGAVASDVRYVPLGMPSSDSLDSPSFQLIGTVVLGAGCGASP